MGPLFRSARLAILLTGPNVSALRDNSRRSIGKFAPGYLAEYTGLIAKCWAEGTATRNEAQGIYICGTEGTENGNGASGVD